MTTLKIQFRRGTAAEWASANPVLLMAERGYETDTGFWKTGNGSAAWNSLKYDLGDMTVAVVTGNEPRPPTTGVVTFKDTRAPGMSQPTHWANGDLWLRRLA